MNTYIRFLLGLGALGLGHALALAGDNTPPPRVPEVGNALLLDNERLVEGLICRDGNRYRIKRDLGESWIPADKVIRLCASRADAYQCLRSRANLRDVDERLRLARWCHLHELDQQAVAELQAALELKPDCNEARRMLRCLQDPNSIPETPAAPPSDTVKPAADEPSGEAKASPAEPPPPTGLSMEASTLFSMRVQPILMNACVNCHTSERGGSFRLMPTYDDGSGNRRATQHNLAATVAQINRANWSASPLLMKAGSIHGTLAQPPLRGRQLPAFHTLETWVQEVAAAAPAPTVLANAAPSKSGETFHAAESAASAEKAAEPAPSQWAADQKPAKTVEPGASAAQAAPAPDRPSESLLPTPKDGKDAAREVPHAASTAPKPPPQPADEFDPLHFNQIAHPERVAAQGKP